MKQVVLKKFDQEVIDFLNMEHSVYKNLIYDKSFKHRLIEESSLCWKEDQLHYAYSTFRIRKGKKCYYLKKANRNGFTLDTKGKLKFWFGKSSPAEMPGLKDVLDHLRIEWIHTNMMPFLTKGIFEKILKGKITNPIDFFNAYLKAVHIKASPKLLYHNVIHRNLLKSVFLRSAYLAENVDHYLELWSDSSRRQKIASMLMDFETQCVTLEKKINYRWSDKRIEEEHSQCSAILMNLEVQNMEDEKLNKLEPFKIVGLELLDTKKKVFAEGWSQKHCVFTNYWERVKNENYIVYSFDYSGEKATVGAYLTKDGIVIDQIRGKRNASCSSELETTVRGRIDKFNLENIGLFSNFKARRVGSLYPELFDNN